MIGQEQFYNTRSLVSTSASKLTPTVAAIGELELTGNLTAHSWYGHLKLPSGHTDLVGITLLGEIVYQYRPGVVRDETTGEPLHTFKRFARDKFCAPVAYFEKKFGLTKDQVRQGLKRLEEGGYIRREYRDILVAGRWVRGMTFIEPVPERIRAITPPPRPDARPVPGAVQRPKTAGVRPRRAAATPRGEGSAPEGAGSTPEGAVQIPPYKNTAKSLKRTTTTPPTPSSDTKAEPNRWSCRQQADNQTHPPAPAEPTNQSTTTEKESRSLTVEPAPPPASESRVTPQDTPAAAPPLEAASEPPTPVQAHTTPAAHTTSLVFDFHLADLTPAQQAEFSQRLTRLPGPLAQAVLDEYNGAVGRKVQIRSKWGWFEFLIRAALEGRFIPTSDLAERRAAQAQAQAQSQSQVQATTANISVSTPPARQPSAVWEAHQEELVNLFPPSEVGINLSPLRALEDGHTLWLEAPNTFVVNWVRAHLPQIEAVMRPHTPLPIRVGIG